MCSTTRGPLDRVESDSARQAVVTRSRGRRVYRALRWLALAVILAAISIFAYKIQADRKTDGTQRPILNISKRSLDFGTVWDQPQFKWTLPVENATDRTVEIKEILGTCDCTLIEPHRGIVLPPRQSREISLNINTTGLEWAVDQASQSFEVSLLFRLDGDRPAEQTVTVGGRVLQNPISVSTYSIDFEDELVLGEPLQPQSVIVTVTQPHLLSALTASCYPPQMGHTELQPISKSAGESNHRIRLLVRPAKSLTPGPFGFAIHISAENGSFEIPPFREIQVSGRISSGVEPSPRQINFGSRTVGTAAKEFVVLSSRTGRPFTVANVRTSDHSLHVERREELESGDSTDNVFAVVQECRREGDQRGTIQFTVQQHENLGQTVLSVQTSYYGAKSQSKNQSSESSSRVDAAARVRK